MKTNKTKPFLKLITKSRNDFTVTRGRKEKSSNNMEDEGKEINATQVKDGIEVLSQEKEKTMETQTGTQKKRPKLYPVPPIDEFYDDAIRDINSISERVSRMQEHNNNRLILIGGMARKRISAHRIKEE